MASSKALIFEIIGVDKASKAFKDVGHSTDQVSGKLGKLKIAGGLAFAALAVGVVELAKKSVDKFEETGKAAIGLQRILGGTAEQVSRLNFAAEEKGIDTDKLTTGFKILSKHIAANDKAWQGLGVAGKDAHGKTKPFADLLPSIADRFAKMPAGTDKTALALKLFGKSGTNLLPLLNLGKKGLADFGMESDKLGHTLTGPQLDAIKKNIEAHRKFKAAVSGVEIQIGAALYPALTKIIPAVASFAATVAEKAIPVIKRFGTWLQDKLFPALSQAWKTILPGLTQAWHTVADAIAGKGSASWKDVGDKVIDFIKVASKVINVVLPAMARLWADNIQTIKLAAKGIQTYGQIGSAVFKFVANAFLTSISVILHAAATAFGWLPLGVGKKLKDAAAKFDTFRDHANRALNGIHDVDVKVNVHFNQVGVTNKLHALAGARASGGPMSAGKPYLVGENGPEVVVPGVSSFVVPNGGRGSSTASATGDFTASAPLILQLDSGVIWRGLVTMKRRKGNISLGLT